VVRVIGGNSAFCSFLVDASSSEEVGARNATRGVVWSSSKHGGRVVSE